VLGDHEERPGVGISTTKGPPEIGHLASVATDTLPAAADLDIVFSMAIATAIVSTA